MSLLRLFNEVDRPVVVRDRFLVALARAHDVADRFQRLEVGRIASSDGVEDRLGFVDPIERVQVERAPDVDAGLQRAAGRDAIVGLVGLLKFLQAFVGVGQGRQCERMLRLKEQRELQIDDAEVDAAFTSQRLAKPVVDLSEAIVHAAHQQPDAFTVGDAFAQIARERVPLTLLASEVLIQDGLGRLDIAGIGQRMRIGERCPQCATILAENALERLARVSGAAGIVRNQAAMIGQIELRPVGLLRRVDHLHRAGMIAARFRDPCPCDGARQFADRPFGGRDQMLVGGDEVAALERSQGEDIVGHPHPRVDRNQGFGERHGAGHAATRQFHLEGLFQENGIATGKVERGLVEFCRVCGFMVGAREAPGEVIADHRWPRVDIGRAGLERFGERGPDQDCADSRRDAKARAQDLRSAAEGTTPRVGAEPDHRGFQHVYCAPRGLPRSMGEASTPSTFGEGMTMLFLRLLTAI